ncbi:uncharacterized protein LOC136084744 isoform X1 [Hydra vulgaris]|uniref:Uncharacterized protein LOC136084744 isoform X1 n=1 Tax=Hydra vulgaris TaxID=6087 RepID=A0ABM4CIH9_HYDVU
MLFYENDIKFTLIDFKYFYNACNFFMHRSVKCKNPLNCKITHFACPCESGKKVPPLNREYLKDQKSKIGITGRFQIGTVDKKTAAREKRKQERETNETIKSCIKLPAAEIQCDSNLDTELFDNNNKFESDPDFSIIVPVEKNYTHLTNLAKAAIRFEISDAATAALATAVLIDYGIVKKFNKSQIITEKKIFGEKKRISTIISSKHLADVKELKVIGVDGKINNSTLVHSVSYNTDEDPIIVASTKKNIILHLQQNMDQQYKII